MKKVFLISLIFLFFLPAFHAEASLRSRAKFWFTIFFQPCQEHNVWGWAWSENIGWVSTSCRDTMAIGTGADYGVDISSSTGAFSGYAWSENIGWVDFAPIGPYPALPNYSACLDFPGRGQVCDGLGSNKVGGWTKVLSTGGWLKLRDSNYGVDYESRTGEFLGWAWSDDSLGWVSFNCRNQGVCGTSNYKVMTMTRPSPPSVNTVGETWNHCSIKEKSIPVLNWNYSDGAQAAYWVQIDDTSTGFPSPEVDTGEILSSSSSYAPIYAFNWGTRYWWRVKAKNQQAVWSGWSNTDNFDTPKHAYPWPDFNWSPAEPTKGETVEFDSSSAEVFGGAAISSYLWTITQGTGVFVDGTTDTSANPHIQFSTTNNKVKLQITDSDGYSCGAGAGEGEKSITVQLPLPEYKEIPPIIWFRKLLTGFLAFK